VPTAAYLPFCFFNLLSPIISLIYGLTGFHIERIEGSDDTGPAATEEPSLVAGGEPETGGAPA